MILYRHIIKEHILPFFYSLFVIVFIFMMQLAVQLLKRILYKGLDMRVVAELFIINLAWMLVLAVPMAVLVSTLMAFGKMSANNEIQSIKASGQNLLSLLIPVISAGCILATIMIFFHNRILPDSNHKAATLMADISRKKPAAMIEPGVLIKDFKNYSLMVNEVNASEGTLKGIRVYSDIPGEQPATTVADSGRLLLSKDGKFLELSLYDGETHRRAKDDGTSLYYLAKFKKQIVYIPNVDSQLKRTDRNYRGDREKGSKELLADVARFRENEKNYRGRHEVDIENYIAKINILDSLSSDSKDKRINLDSITTFYQWQKNFSRQNRIIGRKMNRIINTSERLERQILREKKRESQYLVEVHKKYSISIACIIFILIGAPLGIMAKRGGMATGASYSILFFIMFWALLIFGENMADKLLMDPALAMWLPNIVLAVISIFLLRNVLQENTIISFAPVINYIKSYLPKKKIPHHINASTNLIRKAPSIILNRFFGMLTAYLMKSFIKNFILILFSLVVLFVVIDYISNLRLLSQATFSDVILYYWYYMAWFIGIITPMGALIASMFSIGGIVNNSELTAMKAAGVSVRRLTFPLILLGLVLSFLNFYLVEKYLPYANKERNELIDGIKNGTRGKIKKTKTKVRDYRRNFYYFSGVNISYFFKEFRTKPQEAKNVRKEVYAKNRILSKIEAKRMIYKDSVWNFVDATKYNFKSDGTFKVTIFDTLPEISLTATPTEMVAKISMRNVDYMSYWELKKLLEKVKGRGEDISRYEADLNYKIALPFMNFIVILVGLSIAATAGKKGGTLNFGIGLGIIFTYWILSQFILALGKNGTLDPMLAAWGGNIIFLIIGILLYQRTSK